MRDREARATSESARRRETERQRRDAVTPCRRDAMTERLERQRARRRDPRRRLRERDPRSAQPSETHDLRERDPRRDPRRLPFLDLPSPASSLHRITVHRITGIYSLTLIFSFKFQNLVNLWSEILRIKETVLVVFECFLFVFLLMNWSYWTDLVLVLRLNRWTELFVFVFLFWVFGFVTVFVALAALHYIDKRNRMIDRESRDCWPVVGH